jgi:ribosomal protein S18 acetylase RimI-like enzyme
MSAYLVREAHPQDLEGVYAVFSLTDTMHREAHPEIFQKPDDIAEIKAYFSASIQARDTVVFVAEANGEIIGAMIAEMRQSADISLLVKRIYISIENLIITENYREQGVGQALMEQIHLWAQKNGVKEIQLTVWDFNQGAIAFYKKLGYQMLHHRMRRELP